MYCGLEGERLSDLFERESEEKKKHPHCFVAFLCCIELLFWSSLVEMKRLCCVAVRLCVGYVVFYGVCRGVNPESVETAIFYFLSCTAC